MDWNIIETIEEGKEFIVELENGVKLMVCKFYPNTAYHAWEAFYREETGEWHSGKSIHTANTIDDELVDFIYECTMFMDVCPHCAKEIPLNEQKLVGFANRCCPDCYPKLKKELEYPGWTC